jgi:hypothetical protein
LLVPGDVVFFGELLGEIAQVIEAEAGPAVQEQNRRPITRAEAGDQRVVISRRELGPFHRRRSSHAACATGEQSGR